MKITRFYAALLVAPTLFPVVYFFVFLLALGADSTTATIFGSFETLMRLHITAMVVSLAVAVFYIVHAMQAVALTSERRIIWVLLLLLGGFIAAPVYWYVFIWKNSTSGVEPND